MIVKQVTQSIFKFIFGGNGSVGKFHYTYTDCYSDCYTNKLKTLNFIYICCNLVKMENISKNHLILSDVTYVSECVFRYSWIEKICSTLQQHLKIIFKG